jgi:hypothetical protein
VELAHEHRFGLVRPCFDAVLQELPQALAAAEKAYPFALFAEHAGLFEGEPRLSAARAAGEADPGQRLGCLEQYCLALGEIVLRCLILLPGGGRYDGDVQVSAQLAEDAFQVSRGERGGAAAFLSMACRTSSAGDWLSVWSRVRVRGRPDLL